MLGLKCCKNKPQTDSPQETPRDDAIYPSARTPSTTVEVIWSSDSDSPIREDKCDEVSITTQNSAKQIELTSEENLSEPSDLSAVEPLCLTADEVSCSEPASVRSKDKPDLITDDLPVEADDQTLNVTEPDILIDVDKLANHIIFAIIEQAKKEVEEEQYIIDECDSWSSQTLDMSELTEVTQFSFPFGPDSARETCSLSDITCPSSRLHTNRSRKSIKNWSWFGHLAWLPKSLSSSKYAPTDETWEG